MLKLYRNYWKNSLNFSGQASLKELGLVLVVNLVLIALAYLVALVLPATWENTLASLINVAKILIFLPAIAMVVRLVNARS